MVKPKLEIIPETTTVIFHGHGPDTDSSGLRGIVRLILPREMIVLNPSARLIARESTRFQFETSGRSDPMEKHEIIHRESQVVLGPLGQKYPAGVVEWPFDFKIPSQLPETVEGVTRFRVKWILGGRVFCGRENWMKSEILAKGVPIRIIRVPAWTSAYAPRYLIEEKLFPCAVSYKVDASRAVAFGSSVNVFFEITPLDRSTILERVRLELHEDMMTNLTFLGGENEVTNTKAILVKETVNIPRNPLIKKNDDSRSSNGYYKLTANIKLPESVTQCRPDVDYKSIAISHTIHIWLDFSNVDGISGATLSKGSCFPIEIFFSTLSLPDETGSTCTSSSKTSRSSERTALIPRCREVPGPYDMYGDHDIIYRPPGVID
ncbi:hypothetical protein K470DRAFT_67763 [Piedraia hortae CBS 480.64]|uniref:Arrestin C-terminal-like domain-containing protein n=1 Tax=Piedraia hortae CBS 480.64 TaxID=1314780 RepID=A0A6A7BYW2_9PEZI|nr:hypothetical protein K470DRAFT_67763 [Piedraia hortae CBS 480.64]